MTCRLRARLLEDFESFADKEDYEYEQDTSGHNDPVRPYEILKWQLDIHAVHTIYHVWQRDEHGKYGKCLHALVERIVGNGAVGVADAIDALALALDREEQLADVERHVFDSLDVAASFECFFEPLRHDEHRFEAHTVGSQVIFYGDKMYEIGIRHLVCTQTVAGIGDALRSLVNKLLVFF